MKLSKKDIHPLDPLTKSEIEKIHDIVNSYQLPDTNPKDYQYKIYNCVLYEPPPKAYSKWKQQQFDSENKSNNLDRVAEIDSLPREAIADIVVIGPDFKRTTNQVIIQLTPHPHVQSWIEIPGAQPNYVPEEFIGATLALRNDQRIIDKCAEYGFNMSRIVIEPWTIGAWKEFEGKRVMQIFFYGKVDDDDDCQYAHPLPIAAVVDVTKFEVIDICGFGPKEDQSAVPLDKINYAEKFACEWGGFRKDMKPIEINQPRGASFKLDGYGVKWMNYSLRIGYGHREGLILQDICWHEKDGNVKELFRRICVNEMVVPYGDPRWPNPRKHAFDAGEAGLGMLSNSLQLGCDCVGDITYLDMHYSLSGEVYTIKNGICIHEEESGILWKHTSMTRKVEVRRNRKLVISHIATLANYEYAIYWYLHLDGTIQLEAKATGILSTILSSPDGVPAYGTEVAKGVNATYHQHFFCARIDLPDNTTISEVDIVSLPADATNPWGNGFTQRETIIESESMSGRDASLSSDRVWKICYNNLPKNPNTGNAPAYKLIPTSVHPFYALPNSIVATRAGFTQHHLWVTKYDREQRYAAGTYINMRATVDGIPKWVEADRNLINEKLVLWHTFGLTHVPRAEDFPVMPVEMCGFLLKASNFFPKNPTLDVPPTGKNCHAGKNLSVVGGLRGH